MTFSEFRSLYPDAFHDARGDISWLIIMGLLDDNEPAVVGDYIRQHFRERKESLEDEIGGKDSD